ncbi:MAG TPA: ABC transporter ATP-binding protein [Geminicoccus sp.]|uniref:ABC transporter ATP-binding protein n=1 Tax=Geminicoccus sp. TaxID=2024832 RepID=UPI002BCED554|nr:ABC transporter ATP-binding protein [Geminicoccus sp.]HWL70875.1 ABC transporter ATP-binding protein [Geminicoccus sp.]
MVRVAGVTKRYGHAVACEDVSFELERGRFLTVLGPSGSGKTTILRAIAGFLTPDQGRIEVHGIPVEALPPYRRKVGMVFQKLALFPHLTAAGNVAYPLHMRHIPKAEIRPRVERYLELVQLGGLGERRIQELSGGQQQRVAIARALVFEPDLLLLDEPLAALDRKLREEMQLEFRRIQQELGVTTINVTHDQREALVMSDRILVMANGRVRQDAPPEITYGRPADRFVAGFLGLTNFLPGSFLGLDADGRARVQVGDTELLACAPATALSPGAPVDLAIRAERIRLGSAPGHQAVLEEVIFEGDRRVLGVRLPALADLHLQLFDTGGPGGPLPPSGGTVTVGWSPDDLLPFPGASRGGNQ